MLNRKSMLPQLEMTTLPEPLRMPIELKVWFPNDSEEIDFCQMHKEKNEAKLAMYH